MKQTTPAKLLLTRESIRALSPDQLPAAAGGSAGTVYITSPTVVSSGSKAASVVSGASNLGLSFYTTYFYG
jgi:hypothetical protein